MCPLSIAVLSPRTATRGGLSTYLDALDAEVRDDPSVSLSFIEIPYERAMLDPATAASYLAPRLGDASVIHANDYFASTVARRADLGIPVVTSMHLLHSAYSYAGLPIPQREVAQLEAESAVRSDTTIAVSHWMGERALRLGTDQRRLRVIHNGMSLHVPARCADMRPHPLALCFSGRLVEQKGADLLLPFVRALSEYDVAWTLDICGDGPWYDRIAEGVRREGWGNRVRLTRWLDGDAMHAVFAESDMTLSFTRHEPFGLSFLESMACGTPVVGSVRDGMWDYCEAGVNAVACLSVEAVAATVAAFADAPPLLPARETTQASVQQFTWRRTVEATVDVYRAVAA